MRVVQLQICQVGLLKFTEKADRQPTSHASWAQCCCRLVQYHWALHLMLTAASCTSSLHPGGSLHQHVEPTEHILMLCLIQVHVQGTSMQWTTSCRDGWTACPAPGTGISQSMQSLWRWARLLWTFVPGRPMAITTTACWTQHGLDLMSTTSSPVTGASTICLPQIAYHAKWDAFVAHHESSSGFLHTHMRCWCM